MVYGQFRTLISLLIVLALAVIFLWAGSRLLNTVTGAAPPPPTPTVQPAVEQPAVAASPTPRHSSTPRAHPTAVVHHATPTPPRPTATPKTPPEVIITNTLNPVNPATVFHTGSPQLTCWVRNSTLPPGASSVTFNWVEDAPLSNHFLYQYPLSRSAGIYTGAWYAYVAQNPGKYHCDVIVNGQTFGTAHFTVLP